MIPVLFLTSNWEGSYKSHTKAQTSFDVKVQNYTKAQRSEAGLRAASVGARRRGREMQNF